MKTILRIPTAEQYAYLEVELEVESAEDAVVQYHALTSLVKGEGGAGLPSKEWNEVLDIYLAKNTIADGVETWNKMSKFQRDVIQEIKKSVKRTTKD